MRLNRRSKILSLSIGVCLAAFLPMKPASAEVVHLKVLIIVENLPHSLHGLDAVNHAHNGPPPFENQGEPHLYEHVLQKLEAIGAEIIFTLPGSGIIASIPAGELATISHYPGVYLITTEPVTEEQLFGMSESDRQVAEVWNNLLAGDTDDDGMPDEWEALYPACLDAWTDDAYEDPDGDHNPNIHEYYDRNDTYSGGATSNPCFGEPHGDRGLGLPQPMGACPGRCYFADGDGDLVIGIPDMNKLTLELNGRPQNYSATNPPYKDIFDLDGDGVIGIPDKNKLSLILNGRPANLGGLPLGLSVVSVLPGASVAVGDTVGITVELKTLSGAGLGRPGFGVGFQVTSGSASLWGGDCAKLLPGDTICDETDGIRYDISGRILADGTARMVVKPEAQGIILVDVFVPPVPIMGIGETVEAQVQLAAYLDTDHDGLPDDWEDLYSCMQGNTADAGLDYEPDGLTNLQEYQRGTDPCDNDTDHDGMQDGWEVNYIACVNPLVGDGSADGDSDSLINLTEYAISSNPCNPDTDGDTMPDGWENTYGCVNILVGDSLLDGDTDSLPNKDEYNLGSNPCSADTDADGMPDGWENGYWCVDILVGDSLLDLDGDGYTNLQEYQQASNPCTCTDFTPPVLTIVSPQDVMTGDTLINIHITYADAGCGIDLATLVVYHNTVDITTTLTVGDTSASGSVTGVSAEGGNEIYAQIQDMAGNGADDSAMVYVESGLPPVVNIVSPFDGESVGTEPYYRIEYYDPGSSGVDPGTLVILLDSQDVTNHFEVYDTFAEWWSTFEDTLTPSPPPHTLEAWVEDYFGNISSYEFIIFTAYAGGTQPMIDTLSPDFTIAGDVVTLSGGAFGNTVKVYFSGTRSQVGAEIVTPGPDTIEAIVPGSAISGEVYMEKKVNNRRYASNKVSFRLGLPFAYITNRGSHAVTVLDYRDNPNPAVVTSIAMPGANPTPYAADLTPDGRWLFVVNRATNKVTVVDILQNTVYKTVPLNCKTPTPTNPQAIAISPDGSRAFVAASNRVISVVETRKVFDPSLADDSAALCNAAVSNYFFSLATSWLQDLDISPDGQRVFVTTDGTGANGRTLSIQSYRYENDTGVVVHYSDAVVQFIGGPSNANIGPFGVGFLPQMIDSDTVHPWKAIIANKGPGGSTNTQLDEDSLVVQYPSLTGTVVIDANVSGHPVCYGGYRVAFSPLGERAWFAFNYSGNLCLLENPGTAGAKVIRAATLAKTTCPGTDCTKDYLMDDVAFTPYENKVLGTQWSNTLSSKVLVLNDPQVPAGYIGTIQAGGTYSYVTHGSINQPEGIAVWPHFDRDGDKLSDLLEAVNFGTLISYTTPTGTTALYLDPAVNEGSTTMGKIGISKGMSNSGSLTNGIQLPEEGIGYRHFYGDSARYFDNWGTLRLIKTIEAVGREWNRRHPEGPRISIGDMSKHEGKKFDPHGAHQNGLNADLRYVRDDGQETNYTFINVPPDPPVAGYSQSLTQELVNLLCEYGVTFIYDDYQGRAGLTAPPHCTIEHAPITSPHDNHFHILIQ